MDALKPLLDLLKSIGAVVQVLRALYRDYSALLERAKAAPGYPVRNPTSSFWQEDPPFPELVSIQSPELPDAADIVIIGSGIAAVAIARTILHESRRKCESDQPAASKGKLKAVVLEARELCSGATGRNGGHIKASAYEQFAHFSSRMPPERAAALCRFQLRHLDVLTELARVEAIDVAECREVETVDFAVDPETDVQMKESVEELNKWLPEFKVRSWTGAQAREKFGVNDRVVGAVSYAAGALWPYRFVTCLWRRLLDEHPGSLQIETGTTAEAVATSGSPDFPYTIRTSRGVIIRARHVVHATNAFASELVPGLRGKATSALAHMTAQRPGKNLPDLNGSRSWSVMYGSGFDYITQRPTVSGQPGEIMLGGGLFQSAKQGKDSIGIYDDSIIDPLPLMHLEGVMPTIFGPNWGEDGEGGRMKKAWSGIIGISSDWLPLVGRLDPRLTGRRLKTTGSGPSGSPNGTEPGEWIAAWFCGDGMVWAWLCGTALGLMIAGSENEDLPKAAGRPGGKLADWFPPELYASYDRVKGMSIANLADQLS